MSDTSNTTETSAAQIDAAAREFIARKDRDSHPDGKFDNAGRWYPSDDEWTPGCRYVREPSRAWPYSLMQHCRTAEHVAELYNVDPSDVRKRARAIRAGA